MAKIIPLVPTTNIDVPKGEEKHCRFFLEKNTRKIDRVSTAECQLCACLSTLYITRLESSMFPSNKAGNSAGKGTFYEQSGNGGAPCKKILTWK